MHNIEIVPAILRRSFENILADWNKVVRHAQHIQIDVTDGIFAGDGTYREIKRFKQLPHSEKSELHMMVQNPGYYIDDIINLNPARIVFHIEAFAGHPGIRHTYQRLRDQTTAELGLAINPDTPTDWLEENLDLLDYILFLGYNPGFAGQDLNPTVYRKIGAFHDRHPNMTIAVDGHVDKETVPHFVAAGARVLAANSSIFKHGNPIENMQQLKLVAEQALEPAAV